MDRRQALKCAIGAAAGVALGGLPAAVSGPGMLAGSSVLADAELPLVLEYQIPVTILDVWYEPDDKERRFLRTTFRCASATVENDNGKFATARADEDGVFNAPCFGMKNFSRAITDASGNTRSIVVVNVPESHDAIIDENGAVTLIQAGPADIVGGGINCALLISPGARQNGQRERGVV